MTIPVKNIDSGLTIYFQANTTYNAMKKLKYYLSLKDKHAESCTINISPMKNFLYVIYKGETYCAKVV